MYSEYSQTCLDVYRKYFGFLAIRKRYKGRKDAFFNFNTDQENEADQQILRRLAISLEKISDICFQECIDTQYKLFTTEQHSCVKQCTQRYFQGYQDIGFATQRTLRE